jgi:hypothetical protein
LSPPWIAAFNEAVAPIDLPAPAADAALSVRDGEFATCLMAREGSGDTVSVTLGVAHGRLAMAGGAGPDAAVTVRVGREEAVSFLAGAWAPTPALAAGRAQVRGDLPVLRATGEALATLQPHLVGLRAETEY